MKPLLGFLALLAVAGGIAFFVLVAGPRARQRMMETQREELRSAAITAGTLLAADPEQRDLDYDQQATRLIAIYRQRDMKIHDAEMSKAWAQIETDATAGMEILQRIGQIDATKPSGYELLGRALDDNSQEKDRELADEALRRLLAELNKVTLQDGFRQRANQLDNSIAVLKSVADRLGEGERNQAISVSYLPSWDGTYWGDMVQIENVSGAPLDNAVVAVTTYAADGVQKVHLHYTHEWPNGTALKALYAYRGTPYADSQAGARPQRVDVSVYAGPEVARGRYELTDEEWDRIVEGYCSGLRFSDAQFLGPYDEADTGKHYGAGLKFTYTGLETLPVRAVTGEFTTKSGSVQTMTWPFDPGQKVAAGREVALRDDQVSAEAPVKLGFRLSFAGTRFEKRVDVY